MSAPTEISPKALQARLQAGPPPLLLDVREPWEIAIAALPGIVAIPLGEIPARFRELDPAAETVVICHGGVRSRRAATFLVQQGFTRVFNLTGGVQGWSTDVDPTLPTY